MQCRLFYCIMENEQRGMITFILAVCGNVDYVYSFPQSPPSRAAWIEIYLIPASAISVMSPPSRAAWIEIQVTFENFTEGASRRLHGRRGLKFKTKEARKNNMCRRLHGRRGLKFSPRELEGETTVSPPSRAAWIEINEILALRSYAKRRRLHGRRGLK